MKLKSFGCSFVFGSDLDDCDNSPPRPKNSNQTWPAHLAKRLGYEYQCYARPGGGNLQIAEQVLNQLEVSLDSDLFVIAWTWIDRFDYWTDSCVLGTDFYKTNWKTISPGDTEELSKLYYQNLHTEYRDKLTTLMNMKLIIDTLKQKRIPFVMTYMDQLVFDKQWHVSASILALQSYVQSYMTTFEGQTFLDWSRSHAYPESVAWHPLEQAHQAAADYLIEHLKGKNETTHIDHGPTRLGQNLLG